MLNLENDGELPRYWWKKAREEIEKEKREFVKSNKLGGNPYNLPLDTPKNQLDKILKDKRK